MSSPTPHIVEVTAETFEREVIERSATVPVVVDFWAEWCGPCRWLGPVLEKLAEEYAGRFILVKAETDRLNEAAAAFGVRSIPAVFGLRNGQVVDGFVGAQPEPVIRAFLDRLLPTPAEELATEAAALEATDPAAAEARYRALLELVPADPTATIGLARVALGRGLLEPARALIAGLERRGYLEPEAQRLKAQLSLHGDHADPAAAIAQERAAHAENPAEPARALALAEALAAGAEYEEALALALELVERDRQGTGEDARKLMLAIFQVLPLDSDLVHDYRRRLSFVL